AQVTEPVRANARIVADSAARCQAMLDQIMVYSFIQQRPLRCVRHEGRVLVQRALDETADLARERGVTVTFNVAGFVVGDDQLIVRALRAVIANAFQQTREGAVSYVDIVGMRCGDAWLLRVVDNGVGLERRYRECAFRMFWRLDPRRSPTGVGSGLAIA